MTTSLLDALRAKRKQIEANQQRDFTVSPPPGNSRWRLLPHWTGDANLNPAVQYGQHFVRDPMTNEVRMVVVCESKTFDRPCEVCDEINRIMLDNPDEATVNALKNAQAQQKFIFNAVQYEKSTGYHKEVKQLAVPQTVYAAISAVAETYLEVGEEQNPFNLDTGRDIIITRSGVAKNTKYSVVASPVANPIDHSYLEQAVDLDEYVNQVTEEKMRKALIALKALGGRRGVITGELPASVTHGGSTLTADRMLEQSAPQDAGGTGSLSSNLGDIDLGELDIEGLKDVL